MEHWSNNLSIPLAHRGEHKTLPIAKPLQSVSGNRQTFALDCNTGSENQKPHDLYYLSSSFSDSKYPQSTFPAAATLRSNDEQPALIRLQHKHHRRYRHHGSSIDPEFQDRSYLTSKKYLEYRARRRKDLGPDNKQVWSDEVEEAFQEGEVHPISDFKIINAGQLFSRLSRWGEADALSMEN
jgi:hypothetical protein